MTAIGSIRGAIQGELILPDDPTYEDARRVWNGMIDRRPVAVVSVAGTEDIAPVLRFVREQGLPLAIRGGGHNVAGNGTVDGGIVLDLGALKQIEVDAANRIVHVGPGVTLGELDQATQAHGLVVPVGVVSGTGVAGLTLGGGFGWLTRAYGLTVDDLTAVELITADGRTVHASADQQPELFWGLRGGGGNFGVVTRFTFRAHPLGPDVLGGNLVYGRPRWAEALRAYDSWTADLPDELTSIVTFLMPPPDWELGDDVIMLLGYVWAGDDHEAGRRLIEPLRAGAPPDGEVADPTTWVAWQSAADGLFPKGVRAYWKNTGFDRLDTPTIDTIVEFVGAQRRGTGVDIHHLGGAFARVPVESTPFPDRSSRYWLNIYGYWADAADDAERIAWTKGFAAAMQPHATGAQYVNFLGNEGRTDARGQALAVYGPDKLERLVTLKRRFDPENLFRLNHNIPPD